MVNQWFIGRLPTLPRRVIPLLSAFFSNYSINIKRFA
jgi:hypothetical protein